MSKPKIAFVGLGRMGANMARRLKDEGYKIKAVFDTDKKIAWELAEELKADAPATLAEVTASADVIFTVVSDDRAMRKIFTIARGADSLLKDSEGKTFINCATVTPAVHVEIARNAKRRKAETLEACMASSISQAREGTLYLMCGGEKETYKSVKKVLKKMSVKKRFIGPAGKASELKALVNMVMNANTAALAEGLGLASALKLDLKTTCKVFAQTGANSRVLETDSEDMIDRDHECWFSAAHAAKDSGIAAALARSAKLTLPVNAATLAQYKKMSAEGLGDLDKSGIAELTFPGRHIAKKKVARKRPVKKKAAKKRATKKKAPRK